jgi:hypothetical protein
VSSSEVEAVLRRVDEFVRALNIPVSESMRRDGWNEEKLVLMCEILESFAARVRVGDGIPPARERLTGMVRDLDHMGIHGGTLLERLAGFENDLKRMA